MKATKRKKNRVITIVALILAVLVILALFIKLFPKRRDPKPEPPHEHVDVDGDHLCDVCGEVLEHEHVDEADKDGFCDVCGEPMPEPPPQTSPSIRFEDGDDAIIFGGLYEPTFELDKEQLVFVPGESDAQTLRALTEEAAEWTVAWADPQSEWAQGKRADDYVEAVPVLAASGTASVRMKAPFGAQIKVLCTAGETAAECVCDCLKSVRSFKGYVSIVQWSGDFNPCPVIGDQSFSLRGLYLDNARDDWQERIRFDEEIFEDYTLDQTLTLDLEKSTVSLTEEFIESFTAYAESVETLNGGVELSTAVREKAAALDASVTAPMVAYTAEGHRPLLFGGAYPGAVLWTFPLLTDGLGAEREGDAYLMGSLFAEWLAEGENAGIEILKCNYHFEGSEKDILYHCRVKYLYGEQSMY